MSEIMTENFIMIPESVEQNRNLKPIEKLIYGRICSLASQKGFCWATNSYFAELYDIHPNSVSRHLKALTDEKLIKISQKFDGNKTTQRQIFILEERKNIRQNAKTYAKTPAKNPKTTPQFNNSVNTPKQNCEHPLTEQLTPLNNSVKQNSISEIYKEKISELNNKITATSSLSTNTRTLLLLPIQQWAERNGFYFTQSQIDKIYQRLFSIGYNTEFLDYCKKRIEIHYGNKSDSEKIKLFYTAVTKFDDWIDGFKILDYGERKREKTILDEIPYG